MPAAVTADTRQDFLRHFDHAGASETSILTDPGVHGLLALLFVCVKTVLP